jgi:hypothetical protein
MQSMNLRKGVAAALTATGVLHLALAPEYLSEQLYVGLLFIGGGIASIVLASVIWLRDEARALAAGAVLAGAMAVGFVLSRTVGLPGFHEGEWEASGLLSLLLEGSVVAGAWQLLRGQTRRALVSG